MSRAIVPFLNYAIFYITIAYSPVLFADVKLPFPEEENSFIPPETNLSSVHVADDYLALTGLNRNTIIFKPYNEKGKNRDDKFGKIDNSIRIEIPNKGSFKDYRGFGALGENHFVLDGGGGALYELIDRKTFSQSAHFFPVDTIRAPADRNGKATRSENASIRKKFVASYKKKRGTKFTGITHYKTDKNNEYYLLASRMEGFPILVLKCRKNSLSTCFVESNCYVNGKTPESQYLFGIGFDKKQDILVLGDGRNQEIKKYKFNSCFDIKYTSSIKLPDKIMKLTNVHIDANSNLWFTTDYLDNYLSASIYQYPKDVWLKN